MAALKRKVEAIKQKKLKKEMEKKEKRKHWYQ